MRKKKMKPSLERLPQRSNRNNFKTTRRYSPIIYLFIKTIFFYLKKNQYKLIFFFLIKMIRINAIQINQFISKRKRKTSGGVKIGGEIRRERAKFSPSNFFFLPFDFKLNLDSFLLFSSFFSFLSFFF